MMPIPSELFTYHVGEDYFHVDFNFSRLSEQPCLYIYLGGMLLFGMKFEIKHFLLNYRKQTGVFCPWRASLQ